MIARAAGCVHVDAKDLRGLFYVASDGGDQNPGTTDQPFATLARAWDAVRELTKGGQKEDITVLIRGGTYWLKEPLVFGPEDSGTEQFAITYAAAPGERPVISGGRAITGWKKGEGDLWTVEIPEVKAGTSYFRQLFVNGKRAMRGRTPNSDANPPYWKLAGVDANKLSLPAGSVGDWRNVSDMEIVVIGAWGITRKRVLSVDEKAGTVSWAGSYARVGYNCPEAGRWGFLENAPEMLDRPGEWCLDRQTGVLAYRPLPNQDMATAEVVAPVLTRLVEVVGQAQHRVRNVHFKGLRFAHAEWPLPADGYFGRQTGFLYTPKKDTEHALECFSPDAAVTFEFASACSLSDGEVAHVGGVGVRLGKGCRDNLIQGNELFDIGSSGLMVGNQQYVMAPGGCPPDAPMEEIARTNRIANNRIHTCGAEDFGAVGIFVGPTDGTVIAHNRVYDLPYDGISVGFHFGSRPSDCRNNRIEFNHIHDVMQRLADGGGIYTLGFQPGTVLKGNLIHDVHRSPYVCVDSPNNGIFLDDGSQGFLLEDNIIYDVGGGPVRHNANSPEGHTWKNNSFGVSPGAAGFPAELAAKAGLEPSYRAAAAKE